MIPLPQHSWPLPLPQALQSPFGYSWMKDLPETTAVVPYVQMQYILFAVPEFRRLAEAFEEAKVEYLIVGGAIRDLVAEGRLSRDIDVQAKMTREELESFAKKHYAAEEIEMQQFAVTVGVKGTVDAIDVALFAPRFHTADFVENDVNAMLYHFPSGLLLDPHGTGFVNAQNRHFRIPSSLEAWHSCEFRGEKHNGKATRVLKMLAKGYGFELPRQQSEWEALMWDKIDGEQWVYVSMIYIGTQAVIDSFLQWKGKS